MLGVETKCFRRCLPGGDFVAFGLPLFVTDDDSNRDFIEFQKVCESDAMVSRIASEESSIPPDVDGDFMECFGLPSTDNLALGTVAVGLHRLVHPVNLLVLFTQFLFRVTANTFFTQMYRFQFIFEVVSFEPRNALFVAFGQSIPEGVVGYSAALQIPVTANDSGCVGAACERFRHCGRGFILDTRGRHQ